MSENKSFDPFDDPEFCAGYEAWLKSIEPSIDELDAMADAMQKRLIARLYDACYDYGEVVIGEFPSLDAVMLALDEDRLEYSDLCIAGYITITGNDECHVFFQVD